MNSPNIRIENGKLSLANKLIELTYPVVQILDWQDHVIARVESPVGEVFNRNVFSFTFQGDCVWQIEESPHGTEKDKPYVDIFLDEADVLVAANWNGVDYIVDGNTGGITTKAFNK